MTTQPAKKNYVAIGPAPYGLIIYRTDTPSFQDFVARLDTSLEELEARWSGFMVPEYAVRMGPSERTFDGG